MKSIEYQIKWLYEQIKCLRNQTLPEYRLSAIVSNKFYLLKDGVPVSTIDLTPYINTNLARIVSGSVVGNNIVLVRNDSSTVTIDISSLTGGSGGGENLQETTDIGNVTTNSIFINSTVTTEKGFIVQALGNPGIHAKLIIRQKVADSDGEGHLILSYRNGFYVDVSQVALNANRTQRFADGNGIIPLNVVLDGITYFADNQGTIDLGTIGGGVTPNLQEVTDVGNVTTNQILMNFGATPGGSGIRAYNNTGAFASIGLSVDSGNSIGSLALKNQQANGYSEIAISKDLTIGNYFSFPILPNTTRRVLPIIINGIYADVNGVINIPMPFQILDEGNGNGVTYTNRISANFGNIGLGALDLSFSTTASSTRGATGTYSFAQGEDVTADGYGGFVTGYNNRSQNTFAATFGYSNINNGYSSVVTGTFNNDASPSRGFNFIMGHSNTVTNANSIFMAGSALIKSLGNGTAVFGAANADVTATNDGNNPLNPMIIVGNGVHTTPVGARWDSSITRSNLLVGLRNGTMVLPSTSIATIDAEVTGKQITTREWVLDKLLKQVAIPLSTADLDLINSSGSLDILPAVPGKAYEVVSASFRYISNGVDHGPGEIHIEGEYSTKQMEQAGWSKFVPNTGFLSNMLVNDALTLQLAAPYGVVGANGTAVVYLLYRLITP